MGVGTGATPPARRGGFAGTHAPVGSGTLEYSDAQPVTQASTKSEQKEPHGVYLRVEAAMEGGGGGARQRRRHRRRSPAAPASRSGAGAKHRRRAARRHASFHRTLTRRGGTSSSSGGPETVIAGADRIGDRGQVVHREGAGEEPHQQGDEDLNLVTLRAAARPSR